MVALLRLVHTTLLICCNLQHRVAHLQVDRKFSISVVCERALIKQPLFDPFKHYDSTEQLSKFICGQRYIKALNAIN